MPKALKLRHFFVPQYGQPRQTYPGRPQAAPRVHAIERRLEADTVRQLIEDYEAGIPSTRLMVTYYLGKGTVLRLLREHGVQLRNQPMTPTEIEQAVQLYSQGLSLAGQQLGFDHTVIRNALEKAGVPRRDNHGRPR